MTRLTPSKPTGRGRPWTATVAVTLVCLATGSSRALAVPGALDTTFSGDGNVATDCGSGDEGAYAVAVQVDGKIVVAGYTFTTNFDGRAAVPDHERRLLAWTAAAAERPHGWDDREKQQHPDGCCNPASASCSHG